MCKHLLAVKIAEALDQVLVKEIEDRDYGALVMQGRGYLGKYDEKKGSML